MSKVTEKLSFAEMQENLDARKNNSDLENLANALMNIKAQRQAIAKELRRLESVESDIKAIAERIESGDLVEVSEVSGVYNQAHSNRAYL